MEHLNGKKAYVPKSFQTVQAFGGKLDFDPAAFVDSLLVIDVILPFEYSCLKEERGLIISMKISVCQLKNEFGFLITHQPYRTFCSTTERSDSLLWR